MQVSVSQIRVALSAGESLSSTQVNLPSAVASKVIKYGKKIPDNIIYRPDDIWKGREREPHITVKYGLYTDDVNDIVPLLKDVKPFSVTLGEVSLFKGIDGKCDVVKIDVLSNIPRKLNDLISNGTKCIEGQYTPHVTIAYVLPGAGDRYVGDRTFTDTVVKFDTFIFFDKSDIQHPIKLVE